MVQTGIGFPQFSLLPQIEWLTHTAHADPCCHGSLIGEEALAPAVTSSTLGARLYRVSSVGSFAIAVILG